MVLDQIKGKLVVSCQALPDEPLHSSYIMSRMAVAAKQGGAAGIRAQSVEDINAIMEVCDLPMIGIIKRNYPDSDIYITATKKEVDELLTTKCDIILWLRIEQSLLPIANNILKPLRENIEMQYQK